MGLPPSLPSWRSTHELFHQKSLRRCAGHLARMPQKRPNPCVQQMGLLPSLPSWRSTHEVFDRASLRRCAGHLVRAQWKGHRSRHLKSSSPMLANETIAHVPRVGFEEMICSNVQRPENESVQMVELKDKHVEHSLPWPSRNTVQTRRHHSQTTRISPALSEKPAAIVVISCSPSSSN